MKPFRFQKFTVEQNESVFRVGTDAVLLGALATIQNGSRILEVGTGTGIIALMLAQRYFNSKILAIDLQGEAIALATKNFLASPFSDQLKAKKTDFRTFISKEKFESIVVNPPFFEKNNSTKDVIARQTVALNFQELITSASLNLSQNGTFTAIIPAESEQVFTEIANRLGFYLHFKVNIYGISGGPLKRIIVTYGFIELQTKTLEFTIEKSPRVYSDQYLELTSEFHIFGK